MKIVHPECPNWSWVLINISINKPFGGGMVFEIIVLNFAIDFYFK